MISQEREHVRSSIDDANPAMSSVRNWLTMRHGESAGSASQSLFESMCVIVDRFGALPVVDSLQSLARAGHQPLSSMAEEAFRRACMRNEGSLFGRLYDAHLRVIPLVVRGTSPARFPGEIDNTTARHLQSILHQVFRQRMAHGDAIFALPVAFAYTLTEFRTEKSSNMHNVLRQAFAGCQGRVRADAPRFIVTAPDIDPQARVDDQLFDLKPGGIGREGWADRNRLEAAGSRLIKRLARGEWITMRLVPVVLFVPHGESPPDLEGFGDNALTIGNILAFSSAVDGEMNEDFEVRMTPLGLFDADIAPQAAHLVISRDRVVSGVQRSLSALNSDNTIVHLAYRQKNQTLDVTISDGEDMTGCEVALEPGLCANQFVEAVAQDLRSLDIATRVDLGDAMIRLGPAPSLSLH